MKFHLIAFFTNLMLIFSIMYLYTSIVTLIDALYFVKKGGYFEAFLAYLFFIFSWASTFIIYKIKNNSTHFYYFLASNLTIICLYTIFINHFELSNLLISLKYAIVETIIPIIVISKLVSISQNFIGKKLLPERYS